MHSTEAMICQQWQLYVAQSVGLGCVLPVKILPESFSLRTSYEVEEKAHVSRACDNMTA